MMTQHESFLTFQILYFSHCVNAVLRMQQLNLQCNMSKRTEMELKGELDLSLIK